MNSLDWRKDAACLRSRANFFPNGRPSTEPLKSCDGCLVREQCLETALSSPWRPYGIWAGMTAAQLEPLWRERHPPHGESEILRYLGLVG